MRIREITLSRAFVLVTAAMVTAVWALVIPVWEHSDPKREGLSPSQALLDAFMADLCRPPTSTETIYWDTKPFTLRELSGTIRASDDGIRVRALRRIYLDVLLRDPFEGDCAGLRRWVERPVAVEDVARRFATSPEGRRVAAVRDALREVQGRDPAGWDNASVRRWTESGLTPAEIKLRVANQRPLVGVHYFTWYQRDNTSWGNGGSAVVPDDTQQPTLGWYESRDVGTIDRHIEQMEAAGFDFAIVQMVAIAPHIWETTHRFFDRLEGRRLKAVVMLDGLYGSASVTTGWVEKAKAEFGAYSNYLTVRGEPLVLLYSSRLDFPVPGVHAPERLLVDQLRPGRQSVQSGQPALSARLAFLVADASASGEWGRHRGAWVFRRASRTRPVDGPSTQRWPDVPRSMATCARAASRVHHRVQLERAFRADGHRANRGVGRPVREVDRMLRGSCSRRSRRPVLTEG